MKELYSDELSWYHKLFGVWRVNKDSFDTKWGYFSPRFGLEFRVNQGGYFSQKYSIDLCFIWGVFHIVMPFKTKIEESCEWLTYGFYQFENSFVFKWGRKSKHIDIPFISWIFDWHRVLEKDGNWCDGNGSWDNKNINREVFDYTYTLNSGEIQKRKATCFIEERQWHRKWLPFIKMKSRSINVEFDDEVGEKTGSWKGGCIGCGYDMLKSETMEQCLSRMQNERKF